MQRLMGVASAVLLLANVGCSGGQQPAAPSPSATSAPNSTEPARIISRLYAYVNAGNPVSAGTEASRYVFYDDGTFELQVPPCAYAGTYEIAGSAVTMRWFAGSAAGPWGSTASLDGDLLTVHYNLLMQLTDFEDATYRQI